MNLLRGEEASESGVSWKGARGIPPLLLREDGFKGEFWDEGGKTGTVGGRTATPSLLVLKAKGFFGRAALLAAEEGRSGWLGRPLPPSAAPSLSSSNEDSPDTEPNVVRRGMWGGSPSSYGNLRRSDACNHNSFNFMLKEGRGGGASW